MSTVGGLHNIDQQTGSSSKTPNPVFQPRCSRTPLSQLNKGDSVWRDSRTYARSAIQALELKKQQQQENMQRSRIPPPSAVKPVYPADERWVKAYRKAFPTFKIYFDGIEDLLRKRLEEKVKLLGSVSRFSYFEKFWYLWKTDICISPGPLLQSVEQFFSAKCTHIVTGRPVPDEVKATAVRRPAEAGAEVKNQENMTENESGDMFNTTRVQRSSKVRNEKNRWFILHPCWMSLTDPFPQTWQALTLKKTENVSRDGDIFEIAHKHKIKIWSVDSKHHNSTNVELLNLFSYWLYQQNFRTVYCLCCLTTWNSGICQMTLWHTVQYHKNSLECFRRKKYLVPVQANAENIKAPTLSDFQATMSLWRM